ncbi:hypothetical protein KI387_023962, partial [Taxus chinensis]
VGIGEGVSPPAATELIARTIPLTQRSRAVAFVFSGLSVGSVLGLLFAPPCIENFGWESVFYIFGLLGLLWFVGFQLCTDEVKSAVPAQTIPLDERRDKKIIVAESSRHGSSLSGSTHVDLHAVEFNSDLGAVPWKEFIKSQAVWAMVYAHFCGNWGHYTFLSWLPTYFSEELQLDLTNAALVAILPSLGSILVSSIASSFADTLISKGVETTSGLSSTAGAFPGIIGVALTGYLLDQTHSWT